MAIFRDAIPTNRQSKIRRPFGQRTALTIVKQDNAYPLLQGAEAPVKQGLLFDALNASLAKFELVDIV